VCSSDLIAGAVAGAALGNRAGARGPSSGAAPASPGDRSWGAWAGQNLNKWSSLPASSRKLAAAAERASSGAQGSWWAFAKSVANYATVKKVSPIDSSTMVWAIDATHHIANVFESTQFKPTGSQR
jgi:hypothetical protein